MEQTDVKIFSMYFTFFSDWTIFIIDAMLITATASGIITIQKHRTMKRIYRNDMAQAQRQKISTAHKGKRLSPQTKNRIANSLRKYWATLPYKPTSGGTLSN